jgi:hypothetical protein
MRSLWIVSFSFLLFWSCKNAPKSSDIKYEAQCALGSNGESENVVLFLSDTSVILIRHQQDPHIWPLKDKDGQLRNSVKLGNLSVDYSDRNAITGYVIKENKQMDTIANFDAETKKETIQVVESLTLDTVSTCSFTKGAGK